jgi:glycerol uptake facilitator-like aquaporin
MGVLAARRITFPGAITYWIAQLVGACLGAFLLRAVYGGPTEANLGAPAIAAG